MNERSAMVRCLTQQEALAFDWEELTPIERAKFQLDQEWLCMPFDVFHASMEALLGRGIDVLKFTYSSELQEEGDRVPPTAALPEDKPWICPPSLQVGPRLH